MARAPKTCRIAPRGLSIQSVKRLRHALAAFEHAGCSPNSGLNFSASEGEIKGYVHKQTTYIAALFGATTAMAACAAKLPTADIAPTTGASLLLSGANSNVVSGRPRTVYERVARQASRCWFGPFGSVHSRYIMHADVPPPTSSAPVTMAVHRRLNSRKKPWGPALLRVELSGKSSTTTISYKNSG